MRRFLIPSMLAVVLLSALGAQAETTTVVGALANQWIAGDNDYGAESGAPGIVPGVPVRHLRGFQLQFTNTDTVAHTFTGPAISAGVYRFGSAVPVATGASVDVRGITTLTTGTYTFKCLLHLSMVGTLVVFQP